MCIILSYVHRIIRLLHLRGGIEAEPSSSVSVPSKAAASLVRFASTTGLCALFRLPRGVVPVISSGATVSFTGRSLAPPSSSSVFLRLGLPQTRTQPPCRSPDLWRALDLSSPIALPQVSLVGRVCPVSLSPAARAACPPWYCLGPSARHPTYDVPIPTSRSPPGTLSSSRLPPASSLATACSGPASPSCAPCNERTRRPNPHCHTSRCFWLPGAQE